MTPFDVRLWRVLSIRLASVVCPVLPLGLTSVPRCRFRPWLRQGGGHDRDRGWHAELGSGRDAGDVLPSLEERRTGLNRRGQGAGVLISGYRTLRVAGRVTFQRRRRGDRTQRGGILRGFASVVSEEAWGASGGLRAVCPSSVSVNASCARGPDDPHVGPIGGGLNPAGGHLGPLMRTLTR